MKNLTNHCRKATLNPPSILSSACLRCSIVASFFLFRPGLNERKAATIITTVWAHPFYPGVISVVYEYTQAILIPSLPLYNQQPISCQCHKDRGGAGQKRGVPLNTGVKLCLCGLVVWGLRQVRGVMVHFLVEIKRQRSACNSQLYNQVKCPSSQQGSISSSNTYPRWDHKYIRCFGCLVSSVRNKIRWNATVI